MDSCRGPAKHCNKSTKFCVDSSSRFRLEREETYDTPTNRHTVTRRRHWSRYLRISDTSGVLCVVITRQMTTYKRFIASISAPHTLRMTSAPPVGDQWINGAAYIYATTTLHSARVIVTTVRWYTASIFHTQTDHWYDTRTHTMPHGSLTLFPPPHTQGSGL